MIEVLPEILRRKMLNSNTVLSLLNSLYVACLWVPKDKEIIDGRSKN